MAARVAFLIGNQRFRPDSGLPPLEGPANDIAALARLLSDPERGQFDVHEFLDKMHHEVLPDLEQALGSASEGDFFLIYYSGHGTLARNGELCLATSNTRPNTLLTTSILTHHLRDLVGASDSNQVLMLLDCCYSGAVDHGLRADVGSELQVVQEARGFYIITASTGMQAAREMAPMPGGVVMGRFTAALVNGIESGDADRGRKGKIMLSDLRHYLGQVATGSTPQFFDRNASGDPLISHSPATAAPLLDPGVLADLDDERPHRRQGAVSALSRVLRHGDAASRAAAKVALRRKLGQERDYIVRPELESALRLEESAGAQRAAGPAVPPTETISFVPWDGNNLTNLAKATPPASGTALDGYWGGNNSQHVHFIGNDGHVHELYIHPGAGWVDNDLTNLAKAPPPVPGTALDGCWGSNNSQHVHFIGNDGHVHELYIHPGAGWVDNSLTNLAKATPPAPGTALDGYWGRNNSQHVHFIGNDGHVHELYIHPGAGWVDNDLTNLAKATPPVPGTALDGYWGSNNSQHVHFIGNDGHVTNSTFTQAQDGWTTISPI